MKEQAYLLGIHNNDRITKILAMVGLMDCGNKAVRNFSLGMTQRLKLALALLENPDILILDEPANGLDPDGIAELRNLLLNLNHSSGMTIIISSHILSELEQIATCIGILHNGVIVEEILQTTFSKTAYHKRKFICNIRKEIMAMFRIFKCDFYRFSRNKLFYGILALIAVIAMLLLIL